MLRIEDCLTDKLARFAQSDDLNILLPAGIGDCLWAMTKLRGVVRAREAQGQRVNVWLPDGEQKRAGDYLQLIGIDCDYLPNLSTRWIWDRPGSPPIPPRGWFSAHANTHLEMGQRIEHWYPDLPMGYPEPDIGEASVITAYPYLLLFAGSCGYMMGNLPADQWARIGARLKHGLSAHASIHMFGAGKDVEFAQAIMSQARPGTFSTPIFDRPLADILRLAVSPSCIGIVGVASGPLIAASVAGCRTFFAYPRHLGRMPGTWERPGTCCAWSFVSQLPEVVAMGFVNRFLQGKQA